MFSGVVTGSSSSFSSSFQFTMSHHASEGYQRSNMNSSRTTAGAVNIVTSLNSRSITGHTLPVRVHQHYGFEFHLVLRDGSCIRRTCESATFARRVCSQLERGLMGLCSCVFDDRRKLPFPGNVVRPSLYSIGLGHPVTARCAGQTASW